MRRCAGPMASCARTAMHGNTATTLARRQFECSACRTQTSVLAGIIFHKSRTPLSKWFLAIHLITSAKNDVAALELARQLGVKSDTAWLLKQKLMEADQAGPAQLDWTSTGKDALLAVPAGWWIWAEAEGPASHLAGLWVVQAPAQCWRR